ncbi:hypothetical protein BTS2_3993 [Bacillus sp. TS-2]|nr:hypothetical protein BTS2_3993 [Bacillus sp. TS-2]
MKKEIVEINIDVELNDDLSVELEFDYINDSSRFVKVSEIEEEISDVSEFFDISALTTSDFPHLSEDEITDTIIAALSKITFQEVDIEIVFSDQTEVKFKIDGEEFNDHDHEE